MKPNVHVTIDQRNSENQVSVGTDSKLYNDGCITVIGDGSTFSIKNDAGFYNNGTLISPNVDMMGNYGNIILCNNNFIKTGKLDISGGIIKMSTITSNLTNATVSTLEKWWDQTVREAGEMNSKSMLVFKKDRSEWLMALWEDDENAAYLMDNAYLTFRSSRMTTGIIIGKFKPWLAEANLEDLVV